MSKFRYCKTYKAVLVGPASAGKTALFTRLTLDEFYQDGPTVGATMAHITTPKRNQIALWDTAGQEKYKSIVPLYLRNVHVVIIVFNHEHDDVFRDVFKTELEYMLESTSSLQAPILVEVFTKCDLCRPSSLQEHVISSKTGEGIDMFKDALLALVEEIKDREGEEKEIKKKKENKSCC